MQEIKLLLTTHAGTPLESLTLDIGKNSHAVWSYRGIRLPVELNSSGSSRALAELVIFACFALEQFGVHATIQQSELIMASRANAPYKQMAKISHYLR